MARYQIHKRQDGSWEVILNDASDAAFIFETIEDVFAFAHLLEDASSDGASELALLNLARDIAPSRFKRTLSAR
jgi:hypothetical protein